MSANALSRYCALSFDYFVSTQQKRSWHRRFDLSGITMGLPARADLVLRFGLEIAGIMALVQLFFSRPAGAVDHSPALNGRALAVFLRPACQVFVFARLQELARVV